MWTKVIFYLFRALYEVGMTGIPIYNVNNNCATGSSALHLGKKFIQGGIYDCVMALGFEKMGNHFLNFRERFIKHEISW